MQQGAEAEEFTEQKTIGMLPVLLQDDPEKDLIRVAKSHEKLLVDRSYICLEDLQYIKRIFESYDFVKTGKSAQMDVEVRRMAMPVIRKKKRDPVTGRRESLQIEPLVQADHLLPPLRVDDAATAKRRRKQLLFGIISTRPGIDSERREDGQNECLLDVGSEDDSEEDIAEAMWEESAAGKKVLERDTATALYHIEENQKVVDAEIEKMETWRIHQEMLRAEAIANQQVKAMANLISPTVPLPVTMLPSSTGVPFVFFAQQIIARYFPYFFPVNSGPRAFQPRRRQHVKAVQELFRLMDTNADQLVSWDEFSSHILQAGQRLILETELLRAAARARSAGGSRSEEAPAEEVQGSTAAVEYDLIFTPEPTNSSSWQTIYPLVHHLYHEEPITKMVVSERTRHYITAAGDGLLKLWKPDPRLLDSQHRMAIVHERNLVCTRAAVTDVTLSSPGLGDAEVAAAAAMDGTITLMRTSTGEVVRTLLGVRGREEGGVEVLNDIAARGADREKKEFEADDLLSLRNRQPVVAGTVVRMPYTIPAYHSDMMEIFFGKTNRYFQGLDVVAPTYTHLKRPVASSSDILYDFGAEKLLKKLVERGEAPETTRKCWFATSLAVAYCNPQVSNASLKRGAYLVLGFEAGIVQAYELSMNWFSITQLSATRVEPPSARSPSQSVLVHMASISNIIISETSDLLITGSDDGTVQVRHFSRMNHPHLMLGEGFISKALIPPALRQFRHRKEAAARRRQSSDSNASTASLGGSDTVGHSKRLTCICWNEENHLIVTGGMDHKVIMWTSRSNRFIRVIDLREVQSSLMELGACGYPIDLSFMMRSSDPLRVLVLDSKRVIRFFNAMTGACMGVLMDQSPNSLSLGDLLVARYEPTDDRLLLGGRCVRAWDIPRDEEYAKGYFGHRKPIVFMGMDNTLKILVTADEDNIVMWGNSIIPHELALQRRDDRRRLRECARVKARKDAEKRRALRMSRKAKEAAEQLQRQQESGEVPMPGGTNAELLSDEDDEEQPARLSSVASNDSEEEEISHINSEAYLDEIPVIHHLDRNLFNLTYWRSASRVIRTWKVDLGIRSVTLETSTRAGGIYVALLRARSIVQYNSFNGAPLRTFAFPETATDLYSLYAGEAVLNQTENALAPLLCAAYEETVHSGVVSIYHLNHGGDDPDSAFKRELQEEAELRARGLKTKQVKESGTISSHRNLLLSNAAATGVAILPAIGVVVIGGRGELRHTPIIDTTSFALPCTSLQDDPALNTNKSSAQEGSVNEEERVRGPTNLMALFPGRLVVDPLVEARLKSKAEGEGEGDEGPGGTGEETAPNTAPSTAPNTAPSTGADSKPFYEATQKDSLGFIGHITPVRDSGYVFSATNDGIVQLWNIRSSSEVLRFRATLRIEAITTLSISCYGVRKNNNEYSIDFSHIHTANNLTAHTTNDHSFIGSSQKPKKNLLKDSYYVAVGDQSGYVLLLDFNQLGWEDATPLDVVPGIEKRVLVLDRWRAHRADVRGVCFVGSAEVRGASTVGRDYTAGVRREFGGNDDEMDSSATWSKMPCTPHPITIVTAGEDTYIYVWCWESGTISCLGCFGGGAMDMIAPPLTQLPRKSLAVFELARRQYVLHRLVMDRHLFYGHNVAHELEIALTEMESDAQILSQADSSWRLALWGSLALVSGERLPYRETLWGDPPNSSKSKWIFDNGGLKGMKDRMYACPVAAQRRHTSTFTTILTEDSATIVDPQGDPYTPYVFAFVRGTYEEETVKECLLRVVRDLRPRIKKLTKRKRFGSVATMSSYRQSARSDSNNTLMSEAPPPDINVPPVLVPSAGSDAAIGPLADIPKEESVSGSDTLSVPVCMRGILGVPTFKVDYRTPGQAKSVYFCTDSSVGVEEMANRLPHVVTEETRLTAAQGSFANALSSARVSFSDGTGRPVTPGGGLVGGKENLEDAALSGECATIVMERAYISRRREDAIRQILKDQIEEDIPVSEAKEKAQAIQLAVDAGLIAIDTYKDFATTKTSTVLFDKERVLLEPVEEPHTKIPETFLNHVMPSSFNIKQMGELRDQREAEVEVAAEDEWYVSREQMKRRRHYQDSLWAPTRVLQTVMAWESPIPPHLRQDRGSAHPTPPPAMEAGIPEMENQASGKLRLPVFVPEHLCTARKRTQSDAQKGASSTPTAGGLSSAGLDEAVMDEEAAHVWDTALDWNANELNLNALVAGEVTVLKAIAKQSLEDREAFLHQQRHLGEDEEDEDALDGDDTLTLPDSEDHRIRTPLPKSSDQQQLRPRTLRLSEVKKRMTKPLPM